MTPKRISRWRKELELASEAHGVDAFLLAAIMDRESLGGEALRPLGPSGTGDGGHGRGLMQIDDRAWPAFVAAVGPRGMALWKSPLWNILFAGELLQALLFEFGQHEAPAVAAYNAGPRRVREALGKGEAADVVTTGKNYSTDVLARREKFRAGGW